MAKSSDLDRVSSEFSNALSFVAKALEMSASLEQSSMMGAVEFGPLDDFDKLRTCFRHVSMIWMFDDTLPYTHFSNSILWRDQDLQDELSAEKKG